MFRLAYNTNGLAHHRLLDALGLLAELGYEGVAITPDVGALDPMCVEAREVAEVRRVSDELGLELAVETGARFVLDPREKHRPSLLEEAGGDRSRRLGMLLRSIDLAADLGARVVSLWSGSAPEGGGVEAGGHAPERREELWKRLVDGLRPALEHASGRGVELAFEPEPGMFVERPTGYGELIERLGADGERLGLCLDVGHCVVSGDLPVGAVIREWAPRLLHVHLDDAPRGVHEHRMFGRGALDLGDALSALLEVGYDGMAAVELSRDSHRGAEAAREALAHLHRALGHSAGGCAEG